MDTQEQANPEVVTAVKPAKKKDTWFDTLKYAIVALLIVIPIRWFIAEPFVVSGHSMDPNFSNGQYIIINEIGTRFFAPTRGEVIVFKPPVNIKTYYIKRVIGLPGETISINSGVVTIKTVAGKTIVLDEPYISNSDTQNMDALTLKEQQYFVLGDNRPVSSDSRIWGPLPEENIVGTPFISLFPADKIGYNPGSYSFEQ